MEATLVAVANLVAMTSFSPDFLVTHTYNMDLGFFYLCNFDLFKVAGRL